MLKAAGLCNIVYNSGLNIDLFSVVVVYSHMYTSTQTKMHLLYELCLLRDFTYFFPSSLALVSLVMLVCDMLCAQHDPSTVKGCVQSSTSDPSSVFTENNSYQE